MSKIVSLINHDRLFRSLMRDKRIALDFFKAHIPEELQQQVNWQSLKLQKNSFIDQNSQEHLTDLLYGVELAEEPAYFYLLNEAKSHPELFLPLKLWQYMGAIWEADRHQPERGKKKPKDKLPIIYPIIFYNGRVSPYPFPVDFFQLFSQPELAKTVLTSPFHLVDLTVIPDEELLKHGYVAALEMFQKHAFQRDLIPVIQKLMEHGLLEVLEGLKEGQHILKLLEYGMKYEDTNEPEDLLEAFKLAAPGEEEKIMSAADQLIQRGVQQGMQHVALKMLDMKESIEKIKLITGLSSEDLMKLNNERKQ